MTQINPVQESLHRKFRFFGAKHLEYRRKCVGLLPQIFKDRIYEKKGFDSIFEYAAILAGLSHKQVRRTLGLHKNFSDKPALQNLLEKGEISINKLAKKIASIATTENQVELAKNVKILSCRALEALTRDIKAADANSNEDTNSDCSENGATGTGQSSQNQKGSQMSLIGSNFVHVNNSREQSGRTPTQEENNISAPPIKMIDLKLSTKNLENLLELQNKGIDIDEIIETALANRKTKIEQSKTATAKQLSETETTPSRHIPAATKRLLTAEQGTKCSAPGCQKPAQVIHHHLPFAIAKTHDPRNLQKLCKAHHELTHSINVKFYAMKKRAVESG